MSQCGSEPSWGKVFRGPQSYITIIHLSHGTPFRERNYQCPQGALLISLPHVFPPHMWVRLVGFGIPYSWWFYQSKDKWSITSAALLWVLCSWRSNETQAISDAYGSGFSQISAIKQEFLKYHPPTHQADSQGLGLAQSQHWDSVSGPPYFHHQASFPWHSFRERNYQCPPGALIISLPHVIPPRLWVE